ncbi:FG-GAP repeat domain-containing protein [Streptomyces sp. NPDC059247]|uniref:FG-GAP repeat domain-containing protein n=1 Tax=Streptomyces sp. NPDC059247 TaxID=3346790 RepID=UPI0036770B3D
MNRTPAPARTRASGRGLTAAVLALGTVTAVTATLVTAPAATAAPVAVPAAAPTSAAGVVLPDDARIVSTGSTGFLTSRPDGAGSATLTWTRFDGSGGEAVPGVRGYDTGLDVVVTTDGRGRYTVLDMVSRQQSTLEPVRELGSGATVVGVAGTALYVSVPSFGYQQLYRLQRINGVTSKAKISYGYRDTSFRVFGGTRSAMGNPFVLGTQDTDSGGGPSSFRTVHLGGAVYDYIRSAGRWDDTSSGFLSETYTAWTEHTADGTYTLGVDRIAPGPAPEQRFPLGRGGTPPVIAGIIGDWVLYGRPGGAGADAPDPLHALTARNVVTGATTTLLDHLTSAATGPDGTLLVRGGTLGQGEGLYRVSAYDGTLRTSLEVSTGTGTSVAFTGHDVPALLSGDHLDRTPVRMAWSVSRPNVRLDVVFRHTANGTSFRRTLTTASTSAELTWNGVLDNGRPAANGGYVWEATATPLSGIGTPGTASGTTRLARTANAHDHTDNGTADLLARDASGTLWRDDTQDGYTEGVLRTAGRTKIGTGFQAYGLIEAAGNLAGGPAADFVARDTAGVLWSFLGKGDGTFAARTKVGAGWGVYTKVAAGSDLTGDGRPDLVAVDTAGALWAYRATGDWKAPFAGRVKLAASGYNAYDQIAAVGNVAGGAAGDLVARDTAGVLWLFLGKGDGTFAPRVRVGSGWGAFSQLVGMGDADDDGRADLLAYGSGGTYVYRGTGSVSAPFSRTATTLYQGEGTKFNAVS